MVISQKRIKPSDRERGGAFWSEMANRNILLLFCGLFLLALIQPSLQGGKCVPQVSLATIFASSITDYEQVHFFSLCLIISHLVFKFLPMVICYKISRGTFTYCNLILPYDRSCKLCIIHLLHCELTCNNSANFDCVFWLIPKPVLQLHCYDSQIR